MIFTSYSFVFLFLPIIVAAYFLLNKLNTALGKAALIVGSLFFYAYPDISTASALMISIAINYAFALAITRFKWRKGFIAVPVAVNLALLAYFKYTNFAISNINSLFAQSFALKNIVQPLGISFITFQQISYIVSVYNGSIGTSLLNYCCYILYFPKILMGPLMEPVDFFAQIDDGARKNISWQSMASGLKLFSFGLFKKMVLADTFGFAVAWGFGNVAELSSLEWILISLFYVFELYFDFSGYCDMATGISLMLNIELPINFDSPYKAVSFRDLWKRWHMSLTGFFTKYVYIPLGGSRRGRLFTCVNVMIVFTLSGLWHGANWTYILWGVLDGMTILLDRFIEKRRINIFEPARWLLTFIATNMLWLLFRSESISQWIWIVKHICCFRDTTISAALLDVFRLSGLTEIIESIPALGQIRGLSMLIFAFAAMFICFFPDNNYRQKDKLTALSLSLAAVAFVISTLFMGSEAVFVYYNF